MRKYLRIAIALFKASAMSDLEYRLNFLIKIATDIVWYTAQLSVFEVLFSHTGSISGWTLETMRVFMGVLFVADAIWMLLFSENLDRFSEKIRRGDLDLLLAKPVNSQFMISVQKMNPAYLGNFILVTSWLTWALYQLHNPAVWTRLPVLLISVPCSLAVSYSLRFFFSASALFLTRAEYINYIWHQIYRLGTRPDTIYPQWLRYAVLSVLPLGFMASVPARLILDTPDPFLVVASIAIATVLVWFSTLYWRAGLKRYSSASS